MIARRTLLICSLLANIAGCIVWPVAPPPSEALQTGRKIETGQLDFLVDGVTTRDEIIARLGEPLINLVGYRISAYPWVMLEKTWGVLAVGATGVGGAAIPIFDTKALFIAFDEMDRVRRSGISARGTISEDAALLPWVQKWAQENSIRLPEAVAGFRPVDVPPNKGTIVVYRRKPPYSSWGLARATFNSEIMVAIDGIYIAELRDNEYVQIPVDPGSHVVSVRLDHPLTMRRLAQTAVLSPPAISVAIAGGDRCFLEAQAWKNSGGEILSTNVFNQGSLHVNALSEAVSALTTMTSIW